MNHKHMLILVGILLASAACVMRASQDNGQSDHQVVYAHQGDGQDGNYVVYARQSNDQNDQYVLYANQRNGQNNNWLSLYAPLATSGSQAPTQEVAFGQPSDDTEFNKNNIVYPVYGMPHHTSQMQEYYQAQLQACGGVLDRSNVSHHDMRSLIIATARRIQPISVIAAFAAGWIFARWKYKSVPCKKAKDKKRTSVLQPEYLTSQADCSDDGDCYYEGIYE